jgi:2-dehydropantoate 2-reductase
MRVAIYGTGGAGGYFGAHLARTGEDVTFVARGQHLKAIQAHGLCVETPAGEIVIHEALYAGRDMGTVEAALANGTETAQAILAAGQS